MSRRYNMRWSSEDERELKKTVRNFNDKIRRVAKKDPKNKNALPEKMTAKQIKELVVTRQEFKKLIKALKKFSEKGAEEIVTVPGSKYNTKITKWQLNEMLSMERTINKRRSKRKAAIEKWEATSGGQELGYKIGDVGFGQADKNALEPFKAFYPTIDNKNLKMRFRHMLKEHRDSYFNEKEERLKYNYINKGLRVTYYDKEIEDIIEAIEKMPFNQFYKRFKQEGGTMEFASQLPQKADLDANIEHLRSTWIPKK